MKTFNPDNHLPFSSSHHLITLPSSSSRPTANISNNPRKKRKKLMHVDEKNGTLLFKIRKNVDNYQERYNMHFHEDIPPCTECGKRFLSQKALYGHMRCHPERQWRGINPPRKVQLPSTVRSLHDEMTRDEHEVATYLLMLANGFGLSESAIICSDGVHAHEHAHAMQGDTREAAAGTSSLFCGKVFGSGGHRASHTNVKGCFAISEFEGNNIGLSIWDIGGSVVAAGSGGSNGEGHRCDICLKIFSSGQALGGHKRCHWEKAEEALVNPIFRNLDLNFPAQADQDTSYSALSLDLKLGL